jgi:hypothetical protein
MSSDYAFRRLRGANPVQVTTLVNAEDLFDRITTAPPDPRLGRLPHRRPRRGLVLVVALVVIGALASTAPAISNWIGGLIGRSEVTSEYTHAQSRLTLPPGSAWPNLYFGSNSVSSQGAGGSFAVMFAIGAWECYWVRAISEGDIAAGRRAHAALADLVANHVVVAPRGASENWTPPRAAGPPTAVFADDGGYERKERMYAEAAAGRPQMLEQSCRANG